MATSEPASRRFAIPELDALPGDLKERIEAVRAKTGFVPNVFRVLARRPDEFRAFFAYYDALMLREGGLSKAEKEMIVVVTSAANQCPYCVVAHGALVRLFSKDPLLGDQLAVNYRQVDLGPRRRVMLDAALKLATEPQTFGEDDVQALLAAGLLARGCLGHRGDHGAVRSVQSAGAPQRHAAEPGVLHARARQRRDVTLSASRRAAPGRRAHPPVDALSAWP